MIGTERGSRDVAYRSAPMHMHAWGAFDLDSRVPTGTPRSKQRRVDIDEQLPQILFYFILFLLLYISKGIERLLLSRSLGAARLHLLTGCFIPR